MALTTPATVGPGASVRSVEEQLRRARPDWAGRLFQAVLLAAIAFSMVILTALVVDVVSTGWTVFDTRGVDFLEGTLRSRAAQSGVGQALWGSFWIGAFVVVIAFPLGIAAAIYLEEYAADTKLTRFVNINIRNLAGVPSVVYGILGFTIFTKALRDVTGVDSANGRTVLSAGLTLAILVLPIVIITSAEALRAVPTSLREAGFGVGATRWEVIKGHVLPYAAPGIITDTILALARALGEAAPLILVGATTGRLASDPSLLDVGALRERFTAMPIVVTEWAKDNREGFEEITAAAIIVMLAVVLVANSVAILLRNRFEKKRNG